MANVLVVEDQDAIRELLLTYLKLDGHSVAGASDAEQGLAMFRAGEFDIVVSDLMMPGKDGIWLLGQLQAETRECKFILSTGYDGADVAVNALRHGAFDYVVKPVDSLTFKTKVRDAAAALEADARSRNAERAAQRRSEEASVLYSIGSIMARNLELPAALGEAVDRLAEILRRAAFCWLEDQPGLPEVLRAAGGRAPSRECIEWWWRGSRGLEVGSGWLLAPITHAGRPLGCIAVGADRVDAELADLLPSLGEVIGVTVWNAASFARERRRSEQLRAINEFGKEVLEARDFEIVAGRALDGATRIMSADRVALVEWGDAAPRVHAALHAPPADLELSAERWAPAVEALVDRSPSMSARYIPDLDESDCDVGDLVAWARSVVVLPVRTKDGEHLALVLGRSDRPNAFDTDDLAAGETFAELIAVALSASNRLESVERRGFEEQWALLELSDRLSRAATCSDVGDAALAVARQALGADGVLVHALGAGAGVVVASTFGNAGEQAPLHPASVLAVTRVARRPVVSVAISREHRFAPNPIAVAHGMCSALVVVAAAGDGTREAAIEVYWREPRRLSAREIRLASLLAQQVAVGLELARLRGEPGYSDHDEATAAVTLASLEAGLRAIEAAAESATPGSVEGAVVRAVHEFVGASVVWLSFFEPDSKAEWFIAPEGGGTAGPPPGALARLRRSTAGSQRWSRDRRISQAVIPITRGSTTTGGLVVETRGRQLALHELRGAGILAQQGALVRALATAGRSATTGATGGNGSRPSLVRVA